MKTPDFTHLADLFRDASLRQCVEFGLNAGEAEQIEAALREHAPTGRCLMSEHNELLSVMTAVAAGYKAEGLDDRYVVVENPDFSEDNGKNPKLVFDTWDLRTAPSALDPLSRAAQVAVELRRFHRNACYPEAMDSEINEAIQRIAALTADPRRTAMCADASMLGMTEAEFKRETAMASFMSMPFPENAGPIAWIAFAGNGNIRFWTDDPARAEREKSGGMDLRGFTLPELVALSAAPVSAPSDTAPVDAVREHLRYALDRIATEYPVNHGSKFCLNVAQQGLRAAETAAALSPPRKERGVEAS